MRNAQHQYGAWNMTLPTWLISCFTACPLQNQCQLWIQCMHAECTTSITGHETWHCQHGLYLVSRSVLYGINANYKYDLCMRNTQPHLTGLETWHCQCGLYLVSRSVLYGINVNYEYDICMRNTQPHLTGLDQWHYPMFPIMNVRRCNVWTFYILIDSLGMKYKSRPTSNNILNV